MKQPLLLLLRDPSPSPSPTLPCLTISMHCNFFHQLLHQNGCFSPEYLSPIVIMLEFHDTYLDVNP